MLFVASRFLQMYGKLAHKDSDVFFFLFSFSSLLLQLLIADSKLSPLVNWTIEEDPRLKAVTSFCGAVGSAFS